MKDYPIKGFWSKLMVASRSVNNIPDQYMAWAQNARIYDGGIWPRPGKQLLTNSSLGTNNKGGFTMGWNLYQIANSNIYQINTTDGTQTLKAALGYDAFVDIEVYGKNIAIITSPGQIPKWYDWNVTVSNVATVPASTTGIVEYCRNYSFITKDNILYISRPITAANPEYSYDWTGAGSQNIVYDSNIIGLKGTMNGLYVFLENKVEYLGANALQNVSGAATFISTPLGEGAAPISNSCIAANGDKIFYISRNLHVQTVNFIQWATNPSIGELDARPVVGIRELLSTISTSQPTAFAYYNDNFKNIQFHVRTSWSAFNNYALIYDQINDTWSIDTGKNYNYVVKFWFDYYGFSDINTSIYKDDTWFSDNGSAIDFMIQTNNFNMWSILHKMFGWFYTSWAIWFLTELQYSITIDWDPIFQDTISARTLSSESINDEYWVPISDESWVSLLTEDQTSYLNQVIVDSIGDLSGAALSDEPVAGDLYYTPQRQPFDRICDEWRMYASGKRITATIYSKSQIQDFILDMFWIRFQPTDYIDLPDKF